MLRWTRTGIVLGTLLAAHLVPQAAASAAAPGYTIMTPRPVRFPTLSSQPSPTPQPTDSPSPAPQQPPQLVPSAAGASSEAPRPVVQQPGVYLAPASLPRPVVGQLPNTSPLEIVPQATPVPKAGAPITVKGTNGQLVVYNLMFGGSEQNYTVRVSSDGAHPAVEVVPHVGFPVLPPVAPYPYPNYPPNPVYQPQPIYQPQPAPYVGPTPPPPRGYTPPEPQVDQAPVAHRLPPAHTLALAAGPTFLTEADRPAGVDVSSGFVPRLGLAGWFDLDERFFLASRFDYDGYTLVDTQAPSSQHHRDEFDLSLGGGYTLPWEGARVSVGGGYALRQVSVASNQAASLTSPLPFAPSQFFHGPLLLGRAQYGLVPGLSLELGAEVRPYLFAMGDASVAGLGPLFGYGVAPSITWQPFDVAAFKLAYRYDFFTGYRNDFLHSAHGPEASLSWRF